MKTFTYDCITLQDVCEQNTLDYASVMDEISYSDISFGTNGDTLINKRMLEEVLDIHIDFGGLDDTVMISLGS